MKRKAVPAWVRVRRAEARAAHAERMFGLLLRRYGGVVEFSAKELLDGAPAVKVMTMRRLGRRWVRWQSVEERAKDEERSASGETDAGGVDHVVEERAKDEERSSSGETDVGGVDHGEG